MDEQPASQSVSMGERGQGSRQVVSSCQWVWWRRWCLCLGCAWVLRCFRSLWSWWAVGTLGVGDMDMDMGVGVLMGVGTDRPFKHAGEPGACTLFLFSAVEGEGSEVL